MIYLRYFHFHKFDALADTCRISLPTEVSAAVKKRKAEFVAGRTVANDALERLGYSDFSIKIGELRSPVWPESVVGSISHSDNAAVAVAACISEQHALGIDIQPVVSTETLNEISHLIIGSDEKKILSELGLDEERQLTVIFSAKESLFKAIFPYVRHYLEFSDAKLTAYHSDISSLSFTLSPPIQNQTSVVGCTCYFQWLEGQVITLCVW